VGLAAVVAGRVAVTCDVAAGGRVLVAPVASVENDQVAVGRITSSRTRATHSAGGVHAVASRYAAAAIKSTATATMNSRGP
jgi:hypothetical protein